MDVLDRVFIARVGEIRNITSWLVRLVVTDSSGGILRGDKELASLESSFSIEPEP
jgi:hypothetical protein